MKEFGYGMKKISLERLLAERKEKLLEFFETNLTGLTENESQKRLKRWGKNTITENHRVSILQEITNSFKNPLIFILLVVVVVSFLLGDYLNSIVVLMMIIISAGLNFFQEHKAAVQVRFLLSRVSLFANVYRSGVLTKIQVSHLVVGDIIFLNAGDMITTDAIILSSKDFFVNQSALTGEAFPIEKNNHVNKEENDLLNISKLIFAGTNVITGEAIAMVIATGKNSEFGKLAITLEGAATESDFTLGIRNFSVFILRIVVVFVFIIFFINTLLRHDFLQSLSFAIAVAVGLTPEFLPMIMSVTMAKGAMQMAKKGIIIKKQNAIPTFGSIDVLCTDKTGTLTQDRITLIKCVDINGHDSDAVYDAVYQNSFFQSGITNPLDQAVLEFRKNSLRNVIKVDEVPFDFERKIVSIITSDGFHNTLIAKGAPEEILTRLNNPKESLVKKTMAIYHQLSKEGYRVLAVATKKVPENKMIFDKTDEFDLQISGLIAFLDPTKADAREAIFKLEKANIGIKVITGDNELVATKACFEAGIEISGVMLGSEVDRLTDAELGIKAEKTTLFARFSPSQKSRVIASLRRMGHVVGYLGDGINDAPSLKNADVGISVNNAVDVAKDTADIILTEKSLLDLVDGVIEGRKIFGNTMKYILMGLSSNFGNMISVLGGVIFLPYLPMLPIQLLLNNFLYDLSQINIPSDNVDREYLVKPKKWEMEFIRKFMFFFGPISSIFDFATFFVLMRWFAQTPSLFRTGWFLESLATQTLVIHIIRTRKIPFFQSRASKALSLSTFGIVAVGWILPFSWLGQFFGLTPPPLSLILILVSLVALYLVVTELVQRYFYTTFLADNDNSS